MARYELRFRASVTRDLRGLSKADVRRIVALIDQLRNDPRPPGSKKLSAQEGYRVRQGIYRIVYSICDRTLEVEVVKVGHRREVYREP